ncbi:MAG: hypothetical protein P4L67_02050 [Candidatus Pacebacteria bacterium]|nr:hypothetical protein [Candidatus Paceibacterota bacterium]
MNLLLGQNRRYSVLYVVNKPVRGKIREHYPTQIGVWECMDGRTRMESATEMPAGILQSWENGGARFDLRWPHFQTSFMDWYGHARKNGRPCVVLVSWHRSRSNVHLGCKAHRYDDAAAEALARAQVKELWSRFKEDDGKRHLYPIEVCLETDSETMIFQRRKDSATLDVSGLEILSQPEAQKRLQGFYPDVPPCVLDDLLATIIAGNIRHIQKVRSMGRTVEECDHCESIIAVGRGLEWLDKRAFIIGPFDPRFPDMVETAAKIVLENFHKGTVDVAGGAMLLASTPFRECLGRPGREMAGLRASSLLDTAHTVIKERVPDLVPHLRYTIAGTVSNDTRRFLPVDVVRQGQS